ncbi:acyl-CoA dehydrogenase family protein [Rhodococcus sp. T7]|uniref:acyl-CoA dehydrogenase family protein n=1 Tax=Rhodococcus sp. T7 TaxID=627444 RepID=UPI0013586C73|nr:acyl-CoA dehydrogenase family protein [Rhodococcus sp. T7]KAF0957000.1 Acyl-CoA dehydrogenase [Rhodococcus sp. T7]KAF0958705.1 Acyl-CoA dehydrogenase [Rhodococcus sp. T7]
MDIYGFTQEQQDFAAAVRSFCIKECGSREQLDLLTDHGAEQHNQELHERLARASYLGVSIPEEYGGSGGGLTEQVLLFEELWRGLAPVHGAGTSHTAAGIYKHYASEEQKKEVLGAICAGEVMSISISEPGAGSDAAAIVCKAERTDSGFRINGQKTWCSDAQFAKRILLVARTSRDERPHDGLTMLEVPADAPGLTIRPIATMGGNEVNDLFFTNVEVPASAVVGEEGGAWKQLMSGLNGERLVCAAQGLGMAQRTFDDLLAYVGEREQFGSKIGSFQALRHRIADLAIELESARALTYATTRRIESHIGSAAERMRAASMAKVKVTETAKKIALEGVQMMGGYGYCVEYGMERHLRMSIPPTIYAGTNEIQRDIIAGSYGLRPSARA